MKIATSATNAQRSDAMLRDAARKSTAAALRAKKAPSIRRRTSQGSTSPSRLETIRQTPPTASVRQYGRASVSSRQSAERLTRCGVCSSPSPPAPVRALPIPIWRRLCTGVPREAMLIPRRRATLH